MVDSSDPHADPVHSIDVLLGLTPVSGQTKVIFGHGGAAETPD